MPIVTREGTQWPMTGMAALGDSGASGQNAPCSGSVECLRTRAVFRPGRQRQITQVLFQAQCDEEGHWQSRQKILSDCELASRWKVDDENEMDVLCVCTEEELSTTVMLSTRDPCAGFVAGAHCWWTPCGHAAGLTKDGGRLVSRVWQSDSRVVGLEAAVGTAVSACIDVLQTVDVSSASLFIANILVLLAIFRGTACQDRVRKPQQGVLAIPETFATERMHLETVGGPNWMRDPYCGHETLGGAFRAGARPFAGRAHVERAHNMIHVYPHVCEWRRTTVCQSVGMLEVRRRRSGGKDGVSCSVVAPR